MRRRSLSQSPGRVFYGWWIVAIGCVQDAVKGGLFNTGFTLYFQISCVQSCSTRSND